MSALRLQISLRRARLLQLDVRRHRFCASVRANNKNDNPRRQLLTLKPSTIDSTIPASGDNQNPTQNGWIAYAAASSGHTKIVTNATPDALRGTTSKSSANRLP